MNDPLEDIIREKAETDSRYAIAYALLDVAYQLKRLGLGNAATQQGALECVAQELKEGLADISNTLGGIGGALDPLIIEHREADK